MSRVAPGLPGPPSPSPPQFAQPAAGANAPFNSTYSNALYDNGDGNGRLQPPPLTPSPTLPHSPSTSPLQSATLLKGQSTSPLMQTRFVSPTNLTATLPQRPQAAAPPSPVRASRCLDCAWRVTRRRRRQTSFFRDNCHHFDDSDENKLAYTRASPRRRRRHCHHHRLSASLPHAPQPSGAGVATRPSTA